MKPYEQKDGDGVLFKNEKKSEKHPDYKGNIRIHGQDYWLSCWIKSSKAGTKYMSLSAQPKMARDHSGAPANPPARAHEIEDDSQIPF